MLHRCVLGPSAIAVAKTHDWLVFVCFRAGAINCFQFHKIGLNVPMQALVDYVREAAIGGLLPHNSCLGLLLLNQRLNLGCCCSRVALPLTSLVVCSSLYAARVPPLRDAAVSRWFRCTLVDWCVVLIVNDASLQAAAGETGLRQQRRVRCPPFRAAFRLGALLPPLICCALMLFSGV
jgi:hypothetical protein